MGSASLFFGLSPNNALLSDTNNELVNCFQQVKTSPHGVISHLSKFESNKEYYYFLRALETETLAPDMRAARFIYLTRFCFNGLYRTNQSGRFNVPFGGGKSGSLPSPNTIIRSSEQLQSASIKCNDFEITLDSVEAGDFIYIDPPYYVEGKRRTNQYGPNGFSKSDIGRLAEGLTQINRRGAHFVLSYEKSNEAHALAQNWKIIEVAVRRNVAGFAKHRSTQVELIATNIAA